METVYPAHRASNKNVTNGGAPGLDASLFNDIESILVALNSAATDWQISSASGVLQLLGLKVNPTPVVVNGTTSGTATLYPIMTGTLKLYWLWLNNYRNSTSTEQTIALPVPLTGQSFVFTGTIGTFITPYRSGALMGNSTRVVTGLAASGGSYVVQNGITSHSYGVFTAAPDAIGLGTNQSTGTTGHALIIGI